MLPLELVKFAALMERTSGIPAVKIGLIDGPVVTQHPDLAAEHLREVFGNNVATCSQANNTACLHGTFIAGILSAKRSSPTPAICPDCTLLIRPVFAETAAGREHMPSATPQELAAAMLECIDVGVRVINLSLALKAVHLVIWGNFQINASERQFEVVVQSDASSLIRFFKSG